MSQLGYLINQMVNKTHKEGSYSARASRGKILNLVAKELREAGFKLNSPKGLKTKHVNHLVNHWQQRRLADKTIKNRLSALRWLAGKIDKRNIVCKSNDDYGILPIRSNPIGKSRELDMEKHGKITNEYVKLSLELQQAFGLRREEAIKFELNYALRGDTLCLKGSWTKGGKERQIPITNERQRQLLSKIKSFNNGASLISSTKSYVEQLKSYEYQTHKVGLSKNHGLRHHYARQRYQELTGWKCPASGGPSRKSLTSFQKHLDYNARMQISKELGHERFSITYTYLGS
ncbi:phage integrase N-terminal domain-containing protein [Shewanella algae]|uniref:phage integrase N-terminal domain-containing protein n=1 Tax=Shewanella algae TaxID=38313 RepID=UPI0031F5908B